MARLNLPTDRAALEDLNDEDKDALLEEIRLNRLLLDRAPTQHRRSPFFPTFSGEGKSCDYKYWRSAVRSAIDVYDNPCIQQAIRRSVSNQPAQIISNLDYDCTPDDILEALDIAYGDVHSETSAWQAFYNANQSLKENVVEWHTRLCSLWSKIPDNVANKDNYIKTKLWQGLHSTSIKESARHKHDLDTTTTADLLRYLRQLTDSKSSKSGLSCNIVSDDTSVINLEKKVELLTAQLASLKSIKPASQHNSCKPESNDNHKDIKSQPKQHKQFQNHQVCANFQQPQFNQHRFNKRDNQYGSHNNQHHHMCCDNQFSPDFHQPHHQYQYQPRFKRHYQPGFNSMYNQQHQSGYNSVPNQQFQHRQQHYNPRQSSHQFNKQSNYHGHM